MTATQGENYETPGDATAGQALLNAATSAPAPAPPATVHVPMVERVAALEEWAATFADKHNTFAADVIAELGL